MCSNYDIWRARQSKLHFSNRIHNNFIYYFLQSALTGKFNFSTLYSFIETNQEKRFPWYLINKFSFLDSLVTSWLACRKAAKEKLNETWKEKWVVEVQRKINFDLCPFVSTVLRGNGIFWEKRSIDIRMRCIRSIFQVYISPIWI